MKERYESARGGSKAAEEGLVDVIGLVAKGRNRI